MQESCLLCYSKEYISTLICFIVSQFVSIDSRVSRDPAFTSLSPPSMWDFGPSFSTVRDFFSFKKCMLRRFDFFSCKNSTSHVSVVKESHRSLARRVVGSVIAVLILLKTACTSASYAFLFYFPRERDPVENRRPIRKMTNPLPVFLSFVIVPSEKTTI